MTESLLTTHELSIARGGKQLLRGLHLQCRAGERWAVLGLNGAGKSSLLDAFSGFLPAAKGDISYGEQSISTMSAEQLAERRAHVSQRYTPRFAMRVQSFVEQGAEADVQRAQHWLQALDVAALAQRDITQLSGGELQRAVLARHLSRERKVLLLDEPLTHLDPSHQQQLLTLLRSDAMQITCVIAAVHDVNWAQAFATHVLLITCEGSTTSREAGWVAGTSQDIMHAARLSDALGVKFVKVQTEFGDRWVS